MRLGIVDTLNLFSVVLRSNSTCWVVTRAMEGDRETGVSAEADDPWRRAMPAKYTNKSPAEILSELKARAAQREMLSTEEAASFLNVSKSFLERDRCIGPSVGSDPLIPYVRVGHKAVRYRRSDLEAHISNNLHGAPSLSGGSKGGQSDD